MANTNTIEMKLGLTGANEVGAGLDSVRGHVQRLTSSTMDAVRTIAVWVGITAAITSMGYAVKQAVYDSAMLSARVETLGVVANITGRNMGIGAAAISDYTESIKKMGITTQASRDLIIRMNQSYLDLSKAQELARVAQDAAVIGNINSSEATTRMIYGIQSAQVEVLRTIGLNVNFETSYMKVGKQLGKTVETMTEAEKASIRMNAVLEAGKNIAGSYEAAMGTVGKQLTSLARYWEEAKLKLGEAFKPALGVVVQVIEDSTKEFDKWLTKAIEDKRIYEWAKDIATGMIDAFWWISKAIAYTWWTVEKGVQSFYLIDAVLHKTLGGITNFMGMLFNGWAEIWNKIAGMAEWVGLKSYAERVRQNAKETMEFSYTLMGMSKEMGLSTEEIDAKLIRLYDNQKDRIGQIDAFYSKLNSKLTDFVKTVGEAQKELANPAPSLAYTAMFNVEEAKKQLEKLKDLYKATGLEQYAEQARILNLQILQTEKTALAERTGNWETAEAWIIGKDKAFWEELTGQSAKANAALIAQDKSAQQERIIGYMATAEKFVAITRAIEANEFLSPASWNTPQSTSTGTQAYGEYSGLPIGVISTVTAGQVKDIVSNLKPTVDKTADSMAKLADVTAANIKAQEEYQKLVENQQKATKNLITAQEEYQVKLRDMEQAYNSATQTGSLSGIMSSLYSAYGAIGINMDAAKLSSIKDFFSEIDKGSISLSAFEPDKIIELLGTWMDLTTKEYTARKQLIDAIGKESNWRNKMLVSDLAPVQSKALYETIYQQKLASATANPAAISDFTSFLESDYLPFMKTYMANGSDYKDLFSSIFNTGGVLDQLIGSQSGTIVDAQTQMVDDLGAILAHLDAMSLSDFAKTQKEYMQAMNDELKGELTGIKSASGGTQQNTLSIVSNTAGTWAALLAQIETQGAYNVGGQYYAAKSIDAILNSLQAGQGFNLGVAPGAEPWTKQGFLNAFQSIPTGQVPAGTAVSTAPIGAVQEKLYNIGGVSYSAMAIESAMAGGTKFMIGGTAYAKTNLPTYTWGGLGTGSVQGITAFTPKPLSMPNIDTNVKSTQDQDSFTPLGGAYNAADYDRVDYAMSASGSIAPYVTLAMVLGQASSRMHWDDLVKAGVKKGISYFTVTPTGYYGSTAYPGSPGTLEVELKRWGGLTDGPALAGEVGREWVVPTYEPERSSFLQSVGADPDVIAERVAARIGSTGNVDADRIAQAVAKGVAAAISQSGGKTQIILQVGDKQLGDVLVDLLGGKKAHKEAMRAVQKTARLAN